MKDAAARLGGRAAWLVVVLLGAALAPARDRNKPGKSLAEYLRQLPPQSEQSDAPSGPGSLWRDQGALAGLARDYKAHRVGDPVTILVVESLQSSNTGNVASDRSFHASSGINALAGRVKTGGVENLFSPTSSQSLAGKAQSTTSSSLKTSLTGQVVAVLPGGALVIEARREILMNNERQTMVVRGLVRPGDLAPDNTVASNAVGNLELELKGKGVVSDGTRPPNAAVRWLLRLVGF